MEKHDLDIIYEQLKGEYDLLLTNSFSLNAGFAIDVKVLYGESTFGKLYLYKDDDEDDEFVFSVVFAKPKKRTWFMPKENGTHWHPQSVEQALKDVVAFMDGTHKWLL